jgi:hypothetical protein
VSAPVVGFSSCSAASQEAGEPVLGTAVESVDRWLLLEVTDPWAPDALSTEALPESVRARLARWLEAPGSRFQLIRRPGHGRKRRAFIVVSSAANRKHIAKLEIDRYEDLLDVDLEAVPAETSEPMCLVCVHGRRDRCCALHGGAVFKAIEARGVNVWQTSHLGGHRFAACALWLPDGLMYGRLRAEHAHDFVSAYEAGEVGELALFRGRCVYDRPTQAAEILLRGRLGVQQVDAIEWLGTVPGRDATWEARFRSEVGDTVVRVRLEETGVTRPPSCGAEPEPVTRFVEV